MISTILSCFIHVHSDFNNDVKILYDSDQKSYSFEQLVSLYFSSLEKWELLHPVRLLCLTPWAYGEPRRGLGNCVLIQQVNIPNLTQRNVIFYSNRGLSHSGPTLDLSTATPPKQIVTTPCKRYVCVLSLSSKPKISKVVFKRLSSQMLSLLKICREILCHCEI